MTITDHLPAVEVSAALHAADVAAFPFTAGATTKSGALLSAFAHGLPTLVTAADPPDPELVDGATVVVADRVRDVDALVGPLARLLDDPALRARVAAGGRDLAVHRTWPRIAAAHQELYATVRKAGHAAVTMWPTCSWSTCSAGIGDLVMVLPSLRGLARRHPGAAVRVLTHAPGATLLDPDPDVAEVRAVRKGSERAAVVAELERRPPDLVVSTTRYDGIAEEIERRVPRSVTDLWRRPPPDEPVARRYHRILTAEGLVRGAMRHRGST